MRCGSRFSLWAPPPAVFKGRRRWSSSLVVFAGRPSLLLVLLLVPRRGLHLGQAEPEDRPPTLGPVDVDPPAFVAGHLGHDGQPQPGTGFPPGARGPIEAIEDEVDVAVIDARSVVTHDDHPVGAGHLDHPSVRTPFEG